MYRSLVVVCCCVIFLVRPHTQFSNKVHNEKTKKKKQRIKPDRRDNSHAHFDFLFILVLFCVYITYKMIFILWWYLRYYG